MTTTNKSSVLKDVVAFVDVWSSEKTANYSKPFIEQLQEMGAQVSKTFNKQVTHVVFNNGHSATWRKAKKCNVHLVSILWIGRCYENAVHADEELYPALNDESNPVLKNKRHRCMRPKDHPDKTPENNWRMRKKIDKMKKDLTPKQPVVTDVPSIFIDEENGIVYSPALKRSDYMARRLKDMKDKRENLSPTASQMAESCSSTGLKPFLGSTPTHPKFMLYESDEESSASVAELDHSPDKEEGRTALHVKDPERSELSDMKDYMKPWLSPCRNVPKQTLSLEAKKAEDRNKRKSRRAAVESAKRHSSVGFVEDASPDRRSSNIKNVHKQKSLSAVESENPKCEIAKPFADDLHLETVKSPRCSSSSAVIDAAAAKTSKDTAAPLQKTEPKTPRQARLSLSALVKSFSLSSECKSARSAFADDDDVFEDFFSPVNKSKRRLLPNLPMEESIHLPFELEPVLKKRKRTRESRGSESNDKKKRTLKSRNRKNISKASDASSEPQNDQQDSLPALDSASADVSPITKRKGQNSFVFPTTGETSDESTPHTVENPESDLQENNIMFDTLQSRGNECTVAAGFFESSTQAVKNDNKQIASSPEKMVHTTKAMRTLVMTSMPTEKQHTVVQVVKALGGFSIADRVCESTTHLVSGGDKRTLNILLGIARGCWILSFEWILWCLEQRQWVPEEPYELSDKFPAAQICRLQRHLSAGEHQQDLFQGQPAMFVSQYSEPPTHSLVELIELCGGTVCKTVRRAGICIGKYSGRRPAGSRILSEQWVLDSITHLKQLPYDNYDLE